MVSLLAWVVVTRQRLDRMCTSFSICVLHHNWLILVVISPPWIFLLVPIMSAPFTKASGLGAVLMQRVGIKRKWHSVHSVTIDLTSTCWSRRVLHAT